MSDGRNIYELRSWMYTHKDFAGRGTDAFLSGLEIFIMRAIHQSHRKVVRCSVLVRSAKIQNFLLVKRMEAFSKKNFYTTVIYLVLRVTVEMKLIVVIVIFRMMVIMKNRIICIINIITIRRSRW